MDVEEEDDLSDLCTEILENWNTPIVSDFTRQNPISLRFNGAAYESEFRKEDREEAEEIDTILEETEPDYVRSEFDFELAQKEDKLMEPPNEKGSCALDFELAQKEDKFMEPPNEKGSKNEPIVPVLIDDTFFDKWLGCGADGIDIQVLKETDDAGASSVSNLTFSQNSFELKCEERIKPKGPPISHCETWSCCRSSLPKLKKYYALPSDKTIFEVDIDNFEEKLWRNPGMDMSDFFNYGLDEKQWKYYCKLVLKAQMLQMGGLLQPKIVADGRTRMSQEDLSSHYSDVIIEVTSSHENELRSKQFNKDEALRDYRTISGHKILPLPMDCYPRDSAEDRVHRRPQNEVVHLTKQTRERKADCSENNYNLSTDKDKRITAMNNKYINTVGQNTNLAYGKMKQHHQESCGINETVSITGSSDTGRQHSFGKQREHPISQVSQRYLNRDWFSLVHQQSHYKLVDIDLAEYLTFSKDLENAYLWVKKESIGGILPSNRRNSDLEVGVEGLVGMNFKEDPEKLRRRSERFKLPFQIPKNSIEDKSMEGPTNTLPQQAIGNMDSDINHQRPTRRRKCIYS
ncbi:hypothetical protein ACJIZ3_001403 [Penstemon smallii]|uniref:Pre-mRNA polyadenylation factor Fip1 domain-containing protein n=1 Tax=Penstemon smallii TaxID=265156 RepID=A0ABD3U6D9_9LAMI